MGILGAIVFPHYSKKTDHKKYKTTIEAISTGINLTRAESYSKRKTIDLVFYHNESVFYLIHIGENLHLTDPSMNTPVQEISINSGIDLGMSNNIVKIQFDKNGVIHFFSSTGSEISGVCVITVRAGSFENDIQVFPKTGSQVIYKH